LFELVHDDLPRRPSLDGRTNWAGDQDNVVNARPLPKINLGRAGIFSVPDFEIGQLHLCVVNGHRATERVQNERDQDSNGSDLRHRLGLLGNVPQKYPTAVVRKLDRGAVGPDLSGYVSAMAKLPNLREM